MNFTVQSERDSGDIKSIISKHVIKSKANAPNPVTKRLADR